MIKRFLDMFFETALPVCSGFIVGFIIIDTFVWKGGDADFGRHVRNCIEYEMPLDRCIKKWEEAQE